MNKKTFNLIEKFQDKKSKLSTAKISGGYIEVSDLENSIRAKIEHKGEGLVSVSELKKIFQRNDVDSIELDDKSASIRCGKKEFTISSGNIENFQKLPSDFKFMCTMVIDKEFLSLKSFLGTDGARPAMMGVHWSKDHSEFVATDAHKLKWINAPKSEKDMVINPKVFLLPEGEYNVSVNDSHVQFECDEFTAVFKLIELIDSKFPDYRAIIPTNDKKLTVDKKEFTECLTDALICANPITNQGIINSDGVVSSEDLDKSKSFKAKLDYSSFEGIEGITIGFNIKPMLECLKSIEGTEGTVEISMSVPTRAMILNGNILLMPIRIHRPN